MLIAMDFSSSSLELELLMCCLDIKIQQQIKLLHLLNLNFQRALQVILVLAKVQVKKLHV